MMNKWQSLRELETLLSNEIEKLDKLKSTAKYLMNGRKGAWGRRTDADDKRQQRINKQGQIVKKLGLEVHKLKFEMAKVKFRNLMSHTNDTSNRYELLKVGSIVQTQSEKNGSVIIWKVSRLHTEPSINGRYLTLTNPDFRSRVVHESSDIKIISI